ncbi:MAG TPA: hypothetical protein VHU91_01175 [Mycobacteriales bacterium]|nr:hypothetical protein [Mycobacteriales bacterium]
MRMITVFNFYKAQMVNFIPGAAVGCPMPESAETASPTPELLPGPKSEPATQGTVATFDPHTRSGRVFRDDGTSLEFDGKVLVGEVRLLRLGQRVHWKMTDKAEVQHLTLITLPLP